MLRAIKIRIYPNKEQRGYINRLLGSCRFVYNSLLAFENKVYSETGRGATFDEVNEYYSRLKADNPFLREVHSKVLQQSKRRLESAWSLYYKSFRGDINIEVKHPTFHKKGTAESCAFPTDAFSGIKGNRISLIKALKDIHFKCSRTDERYLNANQDKVHFIVLGVASSGKVYCSVAIDDTRILPYPANGKEVGIDLGIKDNAITSDGQRFANPKSFAKVEKKLARWQRIMARRVKGSRRRDIARRKVARLYERSANIRKDLQQKATTQIIRENQVVYIENLHVAGIIKNHSLSKVARDAAMAQFVKILRYKCEWRGRELWKIGAMFPSSQLCSVCGCRNPKTKNLSIRKWVCPECGTEHDRDINAAMNILHEGQRIRNEYLVGLSSPKPNARGQGCGGIVVPKGGAIAVLDEARKECGTACHNAEPRGYCRSCMVGEKQ